MTRLVAMIALVSLAACKPGEIVSFGENEPTPAADSGPVGQPRPDAAVARPDAGAPAPDAAGRPDSGGGGGSDAGPGGDGVVDVATFPFYDHRDSALEPKGIYDNYSCDPAADESGPDVVYHVVVPAAGFLSAAVQEDPGVDVDVHILSAPDPEACIDRGNFHARADVNPGDYWVVFDTHATGGIPEAGPFRAAIGFTRPSEGACDMEVGVMPRVNDGGDSLPMPATGPIVVEAHLVTQEEPAPYPTSDTDMLAAHYALSEGRTGLVMHRSQVWAPLEGGGFYGAGIGDPADFPVLDEAWYVNMYWRASSRPTKGTRMILRDPTGGSRAVVVAAGFETGPGDLSHVAGTPEETHFYMGTHHLSDMTVGIATDQALPYGPRVCK